MIRSEVLDDVWTITLARPEKRNALTPDAMAALRGAVTTPPEGARCLLVRGEGPAFCAGFDLDACRDDPEGNLGLLLEDLSGAVVSMRSHPIPVVVAAHGAAIAGGCALLGGADVVVADRACKLGYPVVRLGISPAVSAPFLRAGVGDGRTRALQLDPGLVSGERAHEIGLVDELIDDAANVPGRARAIARTLAGKPGGSVAATRDWLAQIERVEPDVVATGLHASRSLLGSDESRQRLERFWTRTDR